MPAKALATALIWAGACLCLPVLADDDELVAKAIQEISEPGESWKYSRRLYRERPARASLLVLSGWEQIESSDVRRRLLNYVYVRERSVLAKLPVNRRRSSNAAILDRWVELLTFEPGKLIRARIAQHIRDFFPPSVVDRYSRTIKKVSIDKPEMHTILLYSVLPSTDLEDMRYVLGYLSVSCRTNDSVIWQRAFVDALLARHGCEKAQVRFMELINSQALFESRVQAVNMIALLSVVSFDAFKKRLAELLRSDGYIAANTVPIRMVAGMALLEMIRDEPDFPLDTKWVVYFTDEQLDALEAWCTKHLDVKYPEAPRKPVPLKTVEAGERGRTTVSD